MKLKILISTHSKHFSFIIKNHSSIVKKLNKNFLKVNNFYLDANSIIYDAVRNIDFSNIDDSDINVIIKSVFAKIDEVQNKTAQQKVDEQQDKKIKEQEIRDKKQDEMLNNINTILENLSKSKSSM